MAKTQQEYLKKVFEYDPTQFGEVKLFDIDQTFAQGLPNYKGQHAELGKLVDLTTGKPTASFVKEFEDAAEKLKKAEEKLSNLSSASPTINNAYKTSYTENVREAKRELELLMRDKADDFRKLVATDQKALKALLRDEKLVLVENANAIKEELAAFTRAIQDGKKSGYVDVSGTKYIKDSLPSGSRLSLDEADKLVKQFESQLENAEYKLKEHFQQANRFHENIQTHYNYVVKDVKELTGHDLMPAVSSTVAHTGSGVERMADKAIKEANEFRALSFGHVAKVGLGAAGGAWLGHTAIDGDKGSQTGSVIGGLLGGGTTHFVSKLLHDRKVAKLLEEASHVMKA